MASIFISNICSKLNEQNYQLMGSKVLNIVLKKLFTESGRVVNVKNLT